MNNPFRSVNWDRPGTYFGGLLILAFIALPVYLYFFR